MIAFVNSDEFRGHRNGPYHSGPEHPETPRRLDAIEQSLRKDGFWQDLRIEAPFPASFEQLAAVHDPGYIRHIEAACALGPTALDADTGVVPASYRAALLAAGGACQAVDLVISGIVDSAFCAVRPPGHHAENATAMGFCLFNNVAVAAEHARNAHGFTRVAILDWDVHHGNGTQHLFEDDPGVFYLSIHQYPHYPGTGAARERGIGDGLGATLNAPMGAGTGDRDWLAVLEGEFTRAVDEFRPEIVLVSAGFDAHAEDPLSSTLVTESGFARMTEVAGDWARRHANGRLVSLLEGGYNLDALGRSVEAHLKALSAI